MSERSGPCDGSVDWHEVARALGHPLQLAVLEALMMAGRASPTQLAEGLGCPLPNLAYHVRQLHRLGLLSGAGTRPRRGVTEHFYRLSARALGG